VSCLGRSFTGWSGGFAPDAHIRRGGAIRELLGLTRRTGGNPRCSLAGTRPWPPVRRRRRREHAEARPRAPLRHATNPVGVKSARTRLRPGGDRHRSGRCVLLRRCLDIRPPCPSSRLDLDQDRSGQPQPCAPLGDSMATRTTGSAGRPPRLGDVRRERCPGRSDTGPPGANIGCESMLRTKEAPFCSRPGSATHLTAISGRGKARCECLSRSRLGRTSSACSPHPG
jgi:hypothetical protein